MTRLGQPQMLQQLRQASAPPDVEKRSSKVHAYMILKTQTGGCGRYLAQIFATGIIDEE